MTMHLIMLVTLCLIHLVVQMLKRDDDKARLIEVIAMGLVLFVFAALRAPSVGTDIEGYVENFEQTSQWSISEIMNASSSYTQSRDRVFYIFIHLLSVVYNDPQIMLIVIGAFVAVGFSFFVYHQKGSVLIAYLLFVCLRTYPFTLTGLRQAMAMSFVWVAYVCLQKNKYVLFILLTCMGGLFHKSAFVFLLALVIYKIKSTKLIAVVCALVVGVNMVTNNGLLSWLTHIGMFSQYDSYAEAEQASSSTTLIIYILFTLFIGLYLHRVRNEHEGIDADFRQIVTGVGFFILNLTTPNMFRIAYYFISPVYAMFPMTLKAAVGERDATIINGLVVILLISQYMLLGAGGGTDDYVFFWNYGHESIIWE